MKPFASGRDADVYALDEHRVLRRYRAGGDVSQEAAVMSYAGARGVPVPEVYEADGADLVLERLIGPTLLETLLAGEAPTGFGAGVLADLHARLHALPARRSGDPAARIIHRDLHPANVILSSRGPVLIAWRNAIEGPPGPRRASSSRPSWSVPVVTRSASSTRRWRTGPPTRI